MRILAVDTSAVTASCAIRDENGLIASAELRTRLTHSQTILPMIENMLKNSGFSISEMDALAVNAGPGSFTGVRIGVAAVKGLSFTNNIPCIPVSTLHSMAYNAVGLPLDGVICGVMDARCGQVYTALFEMVNGKVCRLSEDEAISIEELKNRLISLKKSVFLVGDGAKVCYNAIGTADLPLYLLPDHLQYQSAVGVAAAALECGITCSAAELQPTYLRLPQAERELKAKLANK